MYRILEEQVKLISSIWHKSEKVLASPHFKKTHPYTYFRHLFISYCIPPPKLLLIFFFLLQIFPWIKLSWYSCSMCEANLDDSIDSGNFSGTGYDAWFRPLTYVTLDFTTNVLLYILLQKSCFYEYLLVTFVSLRSHFIKSFFEINKISLINFLI